MFINRSMLENFTLIFTKNGQIDIEHLKQESIPLTFFQLAAGFEKDPSFITYFLSTTIELEEGVTILDLLTSFLPWKETVEHIIKKDITSYIDYLNQDKNKASSKDEWIKISFSKNGSLKEIKEYPESLSFEQLFALKDRENYLIHTGVCTYNINHYYNLFYNKDGQVKSFTGDPLIDVLSYKDVPILLDNNMLYQSEIFATDNHCVSKVESEYTKKDDIKQVNIKTLFTLDDLFSCIYSLLYFDAPLTHTEQQNNLSIFIEDFKKLQSMNKEDIENMTPPNNALWNELVDIFKEQELSGK